MWFLWLLLFIFGILILIMIHEAGHFLFAKVGKMHVAEFSVGFGPAMFQRRKGETTYSFRWIPLGGYVAILSDDMKQQIKNVQKDNISDPGDWERMKKEAKPFNLEEDYEKKGTYEEATLPRKSMFLLAGVTFNYLIGVIILMFIYGIDGKKEISNELYMLEHTNAEYAYDPNNDPLYQTTLNEGRNFSYGYTEWDDLDGTVNNDGTINNVPSLDDLFLIAPIEENAVWEPWVIGEENEITESYQVKNSADINLSDFRIINMYVPHGDNVIVNSVPSQGELVNPNSYAPYFIDGYAELMSINNSNTYVPELVQIIEANGTEFVFDFSDDSYIYFEIENSKDVNEKYYITMPSSFPLNTIEANEYDGAPIEISMPENDFPFPSISYSYYKTTTVFLISSGPIVKSAEQTAVEAIFKPFADVFVYSAEMLLLIGEPFVDEPLSENFSYPNQVTENGDKYFQTASGVFFMGVLITANLMLFNLFPFPPLDGYKFTEAIYEGTTKKKVNPKFEKGMKYTGYVLMGVFLYLIII